MKKYSRYNCYKGCTTMYTLAEAINLISASQDMKEDDFCLLEAKVELYKKIFFGFGNTQEEAKTFLDKKKDFLKFLSEEQKEAYADNLLVQINSLYDDAEAEYQSRTKGIDGRSREGYEENAIPFDEARLASGADFKYPFTRFSKLTNLPISREYRCNDSGVYVYSKRELDYVRVCDALSIKSMPYDAANRTQYIEIEYYVYHPKKEVRSVSMAAEEITRNTYTLLVSYGIVVDNPKLLTTYLNTLRSIDHTTKKIVHCKANISYGYPQREDGTTDYSYFIGADEKNQVIPIEDYRELDKAIFNEKGTANGFIDFLDEVSKGKYTIDFQMVVSASLSCIVQAYVNNGLNIVAPQSYIFVGRTSIGKNLLGAIANNIWAAPLATSLICSSDSSTAYMNTVRYRQMYLPMIIADLQDLIDKIGVKGVSELVFNHSNGQAGGRSTVTGGVRAFRYWLCQMIAFNESDVFSSNPALGGGADARHIILNLNVDLKDRWLTEKTPKSYMTMENKNYAVLGKAFIEAMRSRTPEDIADRFNQITEELDALGVQEKQANGLAMLCLTDELAKQFHLRPEDWEILSPERLINWIGVKEVKDSDFEIYKLLSEQVLKDYSYEPTDSRAMEVTAPFKSVDEIYKSRMKTDTEIRGRIVWEKKDERGNWQMCTKGERERAILVIPSLQLHQLIKHLKDISGMEIYNWSKAKWAQQGWLIKNGKEYTFKDKYRIDITRPRDSRNRETHYCIVLYEE